MNLTGLDFNKLAAEKKISALHLAREFVQLEILRKLSDSQLRHILCFKGGTALHLIFNMDRYSEDLDFSLTKAAPADKVLKTIMEMLEGEEITDHAIKRKTVLVEIRQQFQPQNFRVKLEINTDNIVPAELKTLYSEYVPTSFTLQIMRTDYLIAQKIRALLERKKGRDLYDLWFILRTKLYINAPLVSELTKIDPSKLFERLEAEINSLDEKKISADMAAFIKLPLRRWIREGLKKDVIQLLRGIQTTH